MTEVTVTGRISTTLLARAETVVVERTERIDRLAALGYITVSTAPGGEASESTHTARPRDVEGTSVIGVVGAQNDGEPPRTGPGSHRDEWVQFLAAQGIEFDPIATRARLIDIWDAHTREETHP